MNTIRKIALILSVSIFLILTFIKNQPVKIFEKNVAALFNQKPDWGTEKYPKSFFEFNKLSNYSYKWVLTFFYSFFYVFATYLMIFGVFNHKKPFITLNYTYTILLILIILFAILGLLTQRFDIGFGLVHYLKRLIQNVYLAMFFVIYFWKIAPLKK